MFVYNIKGQKLKLHASIFISLLAVVLVIAFVPPAEASKGPFSDASPVAGFVADPSIYKVKSNEDRLSFLSSFGYEAESTPYDAKEIMIPVTFDPIYEKYNAMQKKEGLDLADYRGKAVTQYRYAITNYDHNGTVYATILVYRDRIIGGDVSSTTGSGFMHGFTKGNHFPE